MEYFAPEGHIIRRIWGKSDTILLIFAGSAAEFALNKTVDWLYFTGKLPADPIGRLFSTVEYARRIIFAPNEDAIRTIAQITAIHGAVEQARGQKIPDWAYRDVLYMLIHYSIAAFEVLERKLTEKEKEEVYVIFHRLGSHMNIPQLPADYKAWCTDYRQQLVYHLTNSNFTQDLFQQYKLHLGSFRYRILLESQKLVALPHVIHLLRFSHFSWLRPLLPLYRILRRLRLEWKLKALLLPHAYYHRIKALDQINSPVGWHPTGEHCS